MANRREPIPDLGCFADASLSVLKRRRSWLNQPEVPSEQDSLLQVASSKQNSAEVFVDPVSGTLTITLA